MSFHIAPVPRLQDAVVAQPSPPAALEAAAANANNETLFASALSAPSASAVQQAPPPPVERKKVVSSLVSRLFARNYNENYLIPSTLSSLQGSFTNNSLVAASAAATTMETTSNGHAWNRFVVRRQLSAASSSTLSFYHANANNHVWLEATERYIDDDDDDDVEEVLFESEIDCDTAGYHKQHRQEQNVLQWLGGCGCPTDVLPAVLAFLGPQMTRRLQLVNRFWYHLIRQECTWKVLCQELYKWRPGVDKEPASWKEYYRLHPCVPVDYKTVRGALKACETADQDIHILLRPGRHYLTESLIIDQAAHNRINRKVIIRTIKLPDNISYSKCHNLNYIFADDKDAASSIILNAGSSSVAGNRKRHGGIAVTQRLLRFWSCTYDDTAVVPASGDSSRSMIVDEDECSLVSTSQSSPSLVWVPPPTRATLVLRTRRSNVPAIRVLSGRFHAHDINIEHSCHGLDIWNGNAAIQIQPPPPRNPRERNHPNTPTPLPLPPVEELPVAVLTGLKVTSRTGRGVVTVDGGQLTLKRSKVHDCAATGVYIGGRGGTRAYVSQTDVLRNGLGSQINSNSNNGREGRGRHGNGGGIARGHSGIYLEQGVADILDCNVSNNTLTGVTAVSQDNSTLNLCHSDLQGNGSFQLEIPARDAPGISLRNNRLESGGTGRVRAGHL